MKQRLKERWQIPFWIVVIACMFGLPYFTRDSLPILWWYFSLIQFGAVVAIIGFIELGIRGHAKRSKKNK